MTTAITAMKSKIQLDSIIQKQKKRYELLLRIYELTNGDETKILMLEGSEESDSDEILSIVDYLAGEELVASLADEAPLVRITHRGVVEVEESLLNPKQPTEHFLSQVIQHFHGTVGAVQTGNQNVANVSQNISNEGEVAALLEELRRHIVDEPTEKQQQGMELLEGLEHEVNADNQSKPRIKLFLEGLGTFVKDTGQKVLVEIGSKLIGGY
jgi:hypothetical protein